MLRKIFLFHPITPAYSEYFINQIQQMNRESDEDIYVFINSPGGYVSDMFAMIDAMNLSKAKIKTVVMGIAASAASIIASNGDERLITENSKLMIHEVWSLLGGSVSDIQEDLEEMTKEQDRLLNILSENTGKTKEDILNSIKKKDKYLSSKDSIDFGLSDRILTKEEISTYKLSESFNSNFISIEEDGEGIEILKTGNFIDSLGNEINIDKKVLINIKENFDNNVRGIDISFDYTHDNDKGEKPAAFWVKSLSIRDGKEKTLVASVEYTPQAKKLVDEKVYRYVSAEIAKGYVSEDGNIFPYVLVGGTLTNRPAVKGMKPIKLSERKVQSMDKIQLINELKAQGVDVQALQAKIEIIEKEKLDISNKFESLEQEHKDALNSLNEMKEESIQKDKEIAFDNLLNEGKVIPSQKEKILSTFNTAEDINEFYSDSPVIVNKSQKGEAGEKEELTQAEMNAMTAYNLTKEEIISQRNKK